MLLFMPRMKMKLKTLAEDMTGYCGRSYQYTVSKMED